MEQYHYMNPINIEEAQKILLQMRNSICKIKTNQIFGNGFFCRIPYKNNTKMNALITSYQIIDENYFNQNNEINLLLNDSNELKILKKDFNRIIFYSREYFKSIRKL